jgi:hypothetical protein
MQQISVMREELKELQPQLEQTSVETQELIKIIERDSEDVAVVKRAVEADEAVARAAADEAQAIKVRMQTQANNIHIYHVFNFSQCNRLLFAIHLLIFHRGKLLFKSDLNGHRTSVRRNWRSQCRP